MALDASTAQEMIKKLADDQATYLNTLNRAHELLAQALTATATGKKPPRLTSERVRRNTGPTPATLEVEEVRRDLNGSTISVDDDSDTDDDESLFVQQILPPESYDEKGLKQHLQEHSWTDAGRAILGDVLEDKLLHRRHTIFPDRLDEANTSGAKLSHYSIYDVGPDGVPLPILRAADRPPISRAVDIWERIQQINTNPDRERKAVGRITIVREPSPLLFAALHYAMKDHFDVDELFQLLVDTKTKALPHRPFAKNPKHRSTFVFTMEYFTLVGDECVPMKWQKADEELAETEDHIPVSRCSSVIALSLKAKPIGQIKNRLRRQESRYGDVHDPFSPWHVLSIQAFPDWKSSVHSHDSTRHYVNGPEAFLVTLRAEFKDAQKRLMEVYRRISELVRTPPDFMFRQVVRDRLLFEDDEFTFSRRYFWAQQSLGIMNEDINEMVAAYRETFTDDVWDGTDKLIWPGDESTSSRYAHWRKRMAVLRKDIEGEIRGLEEIDRLNDEKMKEIKGLRDNLFSGTSVLESRKSVQQQAITVQQGHNIKLLTLVTIFFLPLTFVTSVFGMTNMDPKDGFIPFGIVTTIICIPTYMLIGSLNTTSGLQFWTQKTRMLFSGIGHFIALVISIFGYRPKWTSVYHDRSNPHPAVDTLPARTRKARSQSATDGIAARGGFGPASLSPGGSNSLTMSPANTLERTVQFESPKSIELPRSSAVVQMNLQRADSPVGTGNNSKSEGPWISRLFTRKEKKSPGDTAKELC